MTAFTDIQYLKGVGAKRAEILKSKGIDTVGALLRFFQENILIGLMLQQFPAHFLMKMYV